MSPTKTATKGTNLCNTCNQLEASLPLDRAPCRYPLDWWVFSHPWNLSRYHTQNRAAKQKSQLLLQFWTIDTNFFRKAYSLRASSPFGGSIMKRRRERGRGFASRSRVLSCFASLVQIRELARRLPYSLQQNKVTDITRIRRDRNLNKWLCEGYVPLASIWLLLGYLWHTTQAEVKRKNGGR